MKYLLIAFLTFLPFQFALGSGGGIDIAIVRIFALVATLIWLTILVFQKNIRLPSSLSFWFGWAFLTTTLLSVLWAQESSWALRKAIFLLNFFPLYALATWMFLEKKWGLEDIAKGLALAGGFSAFFALIQFSLQFIIDLNPTLDIWRIYIAPFFLGETFSQSVITHSSWLVNLGGATVFRAVGTFPDPHIASFFWELCLPWTILLAVRKHSSFYAILSLFILTAILLTFSRGAYAALFIGVLLSMFFLPFFQIYKKSPHRIFSAIFLFFLFFASCFLFFPSNPIFDRALSSFSETDGSNSGRLEMWRAATEIISEKPWGTGLGNFSLEILPSANYRDPIYAHNLYLDITAESGVFTLIFWIIWIGTTLFVAFRKSNRYPYLIATVFSLLLFSIHTLFDTPLYSVHILPIFLLIMASIFVKHDMQNIKSTL